MLSLKKKDKTMQSGITQQSNSNSNPAVVGSKGTNAEGSCTAVELADKAPKPGDPAGSNKTIGGAASHLKLGGLSKYLLEKAQSNDSGLDLSPATLQTLVHPLRSSNSSTSSLHVRTLFESPASSDESPQPEIANTGSIRSADSSHQNINASRSALSEQSHNSSEQSTIIENTLTDDNTSKNFNNKNSLQPQTERSDVLKEATNASCNGKTQNQDSRTHHRSNKNADNSTSKGVEFQIPCYNQNESKIKRSSVTNNVENTDPTESNQPIVCTPSGAGNNLSSRHYDSFSSSDVAAVIPPNVPASNEYTRKVAHQTPKPKSCRKKPPLPTLPKKQAGWKFLSEHVQNKEFLILQQLGKGGCGEVSLVMEKDSRRQYALKIVRLHGIDEALVQECINEVEMLIDLKGTDLVVDIHSWEFNRTEKTMKILMEKGQCDLHHTIAKAIKGNKPMRLMKIKFIWESLLLIVDKIHSRGIVHADLKPANFVWVDDNLKIIDFGIASRLQNDLTSIAMPNPKGTLNFISPEIIKLDESGTSKLSPKSDIWALGCILYLMVYGRTPFEHISHPVTKMNAIVQGDILFPHLPPNVQGSNILSVLKLCFQTDYKRRPTAAELLQHPFIHS